MASSASANGRPSLSELQHDLEVVFVQLAQLYGLPAAVQALGQILSREPQSLALAQASSTSPSSPVVSPAAKPTINSQSPQEPEIHTGERAQRIHTGEPIKGGLARALAARPTHPAGLWRRAVQAAQKVADPWASRCLHVLAMEHCIRHRYKSGKHHWVTDDVLVKMEGKPFAAGAMRECFAMKKISTFSDNVYHDWQRAQNCVAKRYKKPTPNDAYFLDVLVQMDAKHMGEAYNRTDPPKQVDIMQAAIVEFPDRHGSPVMCIEQLMTGDYVKYNSNSGFVLGDDLLRYTPQAFSHFTWCWSKGQRICVDIQGVGDLYTDPQIHTIDGESYGDGNLGLRGIALFFRTHQCNALCARLHLKPFERCAPDVKAQGYTSDSSTRGAPLGGGGIRTVVRRTGSLTERLRAMQKRPTSAPQPSTQDELMTMLADVPKVESPDSLVHLEVARVYSEVVLLPELRPEEAPEDALKGALFHMQQAAKQGCVLALTMLARTHLGIEPANTAFGHLIKVARQQGEVVAHAGVAWRAAVLAAERGVAGAALAVAHGYAHCQGLAEGVLDEPQPQESLHWYRRALEIEAELTATKAAQEELDANAEGPSRPSGFYTRPSLGLGLNETIVEEDEEGSLAGSVSCTPPTDGIALERTQSQVTDTSETSGAGVVTVKVPPPAHIPSAAFVLRQRLAAEDEASALPFASVHAYEIHAELGRLFMDQEKGEEAIEHLNQAAELASVAGKGKLAQKYFELAAQAEGM